MNAVDMITQGATIDSGSRVDDAVVSDKSCFVLVFDRMLKFSDRLQEFILVVRVRGE